MINVMMIIIITSKQSATPNVQRDNVPPLRYETL
jgi:hypothetical protein